MWNQRSRWFHGVLIIKARRLHRLVIGVALEVSSASTSPGTTTLQSTFEAAILGFIFGPPETEEKAWKKVREIIEFVSKYKVLGEIDHDD